jgi:hypothetical protein
MFKLISILLFSSLCLLNGQTFSKNEIKFYIYSDKAIKKKNNYLLNAEHEVEVCR